MPTLNEIQHEITTILDSLECAEPEELEQLQADLDQYLGELATMEAEKADSIAFIVRQSQARIKMLKDEEARIRARRQSAEKQLARTKAYFQSVMEQHGLKNIKGVSSTLYLRKGERVELVGDAIVAPEVFLPNDCWESEISIKVNKKKIKDKIKSGKLVNGCSIVETFSLNVR